MAFTHTAVRINLFYFIMCGFTGNFLTMLREYFWNDSDLPRLRVNNMPFYRGNSQYRKTYYTIPTHLTYYRGLRPHRGSRRSPPFL